MDQSIFRQLFLEAATGIAIVSFDGKPVEVNHRFASLIGYTPEEFKAMVFTQFTHPEDVTKDWDLFEELRKGERNHYSIEKRYIRKNGEIFWVELTVERLHKGDSSNYVVAYINDITERKKLAQSLEQTELLFEDLFNNMFQFMGYISTEGVLLKANKSALDYGGFKLEDAVGLKFYDVPWWTWNEEVREQLISSIKKASKGEFIRYFVEVMGKNGLRTIDFSLRPVWDEKENKVIYLIPEGRLVPEEEELEKELLSKKRILENTEKLAKTGGWSWLIENNSLELTSNALVLMGFNQSSGQLNFESFTDQIHPEDVEPFQKVITTSIESKRSFKHQFRVKTSSKGWKNLRSFGEPRFDSEGNVELLCGSLMDVTEDVLIKEYLADINIELTNTVEQLKQFAYITAHDLKEPLRTINSFIQLLRQELEQVDLSETTQSYLNFVESGANRLQDLIQGLLDYTRLDDGQISYKEISVNKLISEVLKDISFQIDESDAKIELGEYPNIIANEHRIKILFQNLISNAIKFRKPGSSVSIHITYESKPEFHEFSVMDDGIGIADDNQELIFKIFKRLHTRSKYEGTGIGLSICKKIVSQHGGNISVDSVEGHGARFTFTLKKDYDRKSKDFNC
ncbi:PAS domain S-box protein [Roseivirga sp.]|uniref:PAS domain S-box protein n=1 Tax=Roseivirga sp. TaxID=1964215 RepID=UPI003B51581B